MRALLALARNDEDTYKERIFSTRPFLLDNANSIYNTVRLTGLGKGLGPFFLPERRQ